jgi:hypothetical protein
MVGLFRLDDPASPELEVRTSFWGGISVQADGVNLARSKQKGRPFLVPMRDGQSKAVRFREKLPDFSLVARVDGKEIRVVPPLPLWGYFFIVLPLLLIFIGGGLGGAVGALAALGR